MSPQNFFQKKQLVEHFFGLEFAGFGLEAKIKIQTGLGFGKFCDVGLGRVGLDYSFGTQAKIFWKVRAH